MAGIASGGRHAPRLLALALVVLLPSLGTSIANVALPSLQDAFASSFGEVQWVVLAYLLALTTLIVGVGRLGDQLGRRRLLLAGIGTFALASAAAALAPGLWLLVAARAFQGLGAAVMMALAVALVSDLVPKERTGSAIGLLGTVSAIGTAVGPSLGGLLLASFGWPSAFAGMAFAATVAFGAVLRLLPADPEGERKALSFDVAGMALLVVSLGAYALAMTLGGAHPGLSNAALAALSVAAMAAFVAAERRIAAPLLRIELLAERGLAGGLVALALVSTIMMATLVVGPFYLPEALRLGPLQTGLVMSTGPAVAALAGLPAGRLVDAFGSGRVMTVGLGSVAAGAALMTVLPGLLGTPGYVAALALITAGYALFQAANNTALMVGAAKDQRALTSALLGLSRNLGLVTGASAMGAVFAAGRQGLFGLSPGSGSGLQLTFAVAALLALGAMAITLSGGFAGSRRGDGSARENAG